MTSAVSGDTADTRRRFERVPLLAAMSQSARDHLWEHSVERTASVGHVLVSQGDPTAQLLVLIHGEATSVRVTSQGRTVSLARWVSPVVIDKVSVFAETQHPASVHADTAVTWRSIAVPTMRVALQSNPVAQQHAIATVAEAASTARHAFVDAAVRSSLSRLARWIAVTSDVGVALTIPRPQERLAQQLGISRVTLNRAIHQLAAQGVIDFDGSKVVVLDQAELRLLADF